MPKPEALADAEFIDSSEPEGFHIFLYSPGLGCFVALFEFLYYSSDALTEDPDHSERDSAEKDPSLQTDETNWLC